jgi:hypothetical protein
MVELVDDGEACVVVIGTAGVDTPAHVVRGVEHQRCVR